MDLKKYISNFIFYYFPLIYFISIFFVSTDFIITVIIVLTLFYFRFSVIVNTVS